ncbi:MAG: glycosyltransferase family 2 protein [Thermoanaerobaculia bacterium]
MFDLTAVFVNHRTADLCREAVKSLRECASEEGVSLFVVVVDCASGPDEAGPLRDISADRQVLLKDNRGYSGGLNAGLSAAESNLVLLCNADVLFLPGALRPLIEEAARAGVGAAAPVQFADRRARIRLPTGFGSGLVRDFLQSRGASPRLWERERFARAARRQWRLWERGGDAAHLTGSILMTRLDVLDRVGRFDERFPFEYEETEWQDRLRAAQLRLRVVAQSRACHFPGSSFSRSEGAEERRRTSRALYRRRRFGPAVSRALEWAERRGRPPVPPTWDRPSFSGLGPGLAIAASLNPSMQPFSAASSDSAVSLPDLFEALGPSLYLRVFETETGEPDATFRASRP